MSPLRLDKATMLAANIVLFAACAPAPAAALFDSAQAVTALRTADSALTEAILAKDAARTAAMYAEDATLLPVAEPIVEGRGAIERKWAEFFGIPGFANSARLTRAEVARGGAMGYTLGTYETAMKAPDGQTTVERGKWVTVWRQEASGWRIVADVSNTDTPPPLHQESTAHGEKH